MSKNKFVQEYGRWSFTFSENEGDVLYYIPSLNFIILEFLKDYNSKGANHYRDMVIQKMEDIIKQ